VFSSPIFLIHLVSEERKEEEYRKSLTYKEAISYCKSFGKQMFHPAEYPNGMKSVWLPEGYD